MVTSNQSLYRFSGIALCLAGLLVFLINLIFTPQIVAIESFAESAASSVWAWRLGLACVDGILLLIASVGIFAWYMEKNGQIGRGLLLLSVLLVGNSLLLAHEWNQFLFVRDLAINFPETLEQLEDLEGFTLFDLSAAVGVGAFFFGWLIAVILLWAGKVYNRNGSLLILLGLVASPFLAAVLPLVYAGIIANAILGLGWFLLGKKLFMEANNMVERNGIATGT